jgi:PTH1 family peptidyl-tRNA hydrolase
MTRHNIGFLAVRRLAETMSLSFRAKRRWEAEMAEGDEVILVLPATYMNGSGASVARCLKDLGIPKERLMVVVDDVALPYGALRMNLKGSAGGHNGLKSVETHLGTQEYPRMRMGIGPLPRGEVLDAYVLGHFSDVERAELPEFLKRAEEALRLWISQGIQVAMTKMNGEKEKR